MCNNKRQSHTLFPMLQQKKSAIYVIAAMAVVTIITLLRSETAITCPPETQQIEQKTVSDDYMIAYMSELKKECRLNEENAFIAQMHVPLYLYSSGQKDIQQQPDRAKRIQTTIFL